MVLSDMLDRSGYFIFEKDTMFKFTYINDALAKVLGKNKEDVLGKTVYDIFPKEQADLYQKHDEKCFTMEEPFIVEDILQTNLSGLLEETIIVTTRLSIRDENNDISGLWGIAHDITSIRYDTEKRKVEEITRLQANEQMAIQSSKLKSEFLANMSHEIRTPMNGIIGLTDLLRDTTLTQKQQEYVDGIVSSCAALMSIINDILDLSKVEAGKIELEILDVDLYILLQDLHTIYLPIARAKSVSLILDNQIPEENRYVKTDYGRLRQIINNLLGNALKFTFSGSVLLRTQLKQINQGARLRFEVIDTGIGIDKITQNTLFRPFTQAEMSTTRRFGGTGLGLSIAKSLVNLMNGDIGVQSAKDTGSTFWFEIPYIAGKGQENKIKSSTHDNGSIDRILNILVAEDNPMNRKVAVKLLEALGQRATTADNGLEALQLMQMNPRRFDLILMDCSMPIMDGYEATKRIRVLPFPVNKIPIIAMTANVLKGEREKCLEVGMNDYITKPVNKKTLFDKLIEWKNVYKDVLQSNV